MVSFIGISPNPQDNTRVNPVFLAVHELCVDLFGSVDNVHRVNHLVSDGTSGQLLLPYHKPVFDLF